ncbi:MULTISPECIES: YggS family pyridoxal phosphate-dependent enzyme [unclassified Francisella]|uniref:YggS family pyridoxal phosphate-dependent enzyme n=1 Tax=unclassified Francisella TaxID=2610885 RepID=UPI002E33993D|nr:MULTISPECIES: YggS family pyridoxal phosphate-dependent enzyme [unclassified Francisella]MED7819980.1 YggS family pyridoxal phosphate-dependent enzyme [Francisella sp. 19S2-4]MED7830798.1 YggS family pyridoxal phosphate-dependent enzyme [Francisella sp. 19S2-10]
MLNKEFIKKAFETINQNIANHANLLAVSKYQSLEKISYLASLGQVDFGENYFQELEQKAQQLPDLRWHFIGSLQSRKIKHIVKYVDSIQSVEKIEHLEKINKSACQLKKTVDIFLQINIDDDISKSGFKSSQYKEVIECVERSKDLAGVKIVGLMCIPAKSVSSEGSFKKMKNFFDLVNSKLSQDLVLNRLSMGMSADYELAIQHGSTDVRIGSSLFGERN